MVSAVFKVAGVDHRGLRINGLPGHGLLFVLFHGSPPCFSLFCAEGRELCFLKEFYIFYFLFWKTVINLIKIDTKEEFL